MTRWEGMYGWSRESGLKMSQVVFIDNPLATIQSLCQGLCRWLSGKESVCQCRKCRFYPWVGKIPQRNKWQPTPVFLPGKSHGQRSLVGYSPWGLKQLDKTEQLTHNTYSFRLLEARGIILFNTMNSFRR